MISEKDLGSIAKNEFEIEFFKGRLVKQTLENPDSYSGSGSISQSSDGKLHLKMYCLLDSSDGITKEFQRLNNAFNQEPGQLIDEQDYFAFEGADLFGHVWKAKNIWPKTHVSFPTGGVIVEAELSSTENRDEGPARSASIQSKIFVVPGLYHFPFNRGQPGTTEPGFSAATIDLGDDRTCEVKTKDGALVVRVQYKAVDSEPYPDCVLEALGICVGAHLVPQVEITIAPAERVQVIRRLDRNAAKHYRISTPLPVEQPDALPGVQAFIQQYLQWTTEPYSQLAGYWFRVLIAFHSGLENQALVLTTAIEGVLKAYFPELGYPEKTFLKEIDDAKPVIEKLTIGSRALGRIKSSLGNAKDATPRNALVALASSGKIPPELVQVWKSLRNRSAHADELTMELPEMQEFINALYACLELFYRLIMLNTGFDGVLVRYSVIGWPQQHVAYFSTVPPTTPPLLVASTPSTGSVSPTDPDS